MPQYETLDLNFWEAIASAMAKFGLILNILYKINEPKMCTFPYVSLLS